MSTPERPDLRIVRGEPTVEELAAVAAIVSAVAAEREPVPEPAPVTGRWNDPAHAHRRHRTTGPGGWRAAR